jgi:hypothetical protein
MSNALMHLRERSRHYAASVEIRVSASILRWARRLYRNGLLTFSDVKYAVRVCEQFRRLAWRLMRWKRRSKDD